ncbi:MAG TPA: tyrosine-protein phosphatase [Acidimicrobiales bacterium]|nr:tyrosine-protein phosphatase [Acidimicrobiales bacterium]
MTAQERLVPLDGILNFRDLGGYATRDGGRTVWRQVFRSDSLSLLTADGWNQLAPLAVRTVFDLRHQVERDRSPTVDPGLSLDVNHLQIGGEAAEAADLIELLRSRGDAAWDEVFVAGIYQHMLAEYPTVFGSLLRAIADDARRPAVFHCTAGKDRTGVAAALLLTVLGVDRETILDDYELSTTYRSGHRIKQLQPLLDEAGIDLEKVRPFLSAPRPALAGAMQFLDDEFGGVDHYLDHAGADADIRCALRAALVEATS